MDKLAVMRAFCRVVERQSFARAADDLGVSASLLSREVKRLEQSLACVLINRTTRTMSLTEHGALYYAEAERLLAEIGGMEDAVRRGAGSVTGRLALNAPLSYGLAVLSPLMPQFLERYPDIDLSIAMEDRVLDMVEGGYDVSIRVVASLPPSSLVVRRIAPVKQRLFAAPVYLDTQGRPASPIDLTCHCLLGFSLADHARRWDLDGPEGREILAIVPRHLVGNSLFLRDLLISGAGIGALPDFLADAPVAEGRLERVLPAYELPERHVFAVTATRLSADAKARAFIDFLRETLGQDC